MSKLNQHIQEYLNYYCNLKGSPGYAVLIKGKWGSGKTWFIKESINKLKKQGKKFLHVSVYGISTFDEIENEFFKQLHPLLSSKSFSLTSKIAQGLLKSTLKIDLTNDGKPDLNINSTIPKINLPEYLTNTDGYILIFDDLERCPMPIDKLLGYINHFVEIQGYKAIIIANEEEIVQKNTDNKEIPKYAHIKEKLIGKTFEVTTDLDGALNHFISEIQCNNLKTFYRSNCDLIKDIHICSQYSNLRHLKQALWDFEYFFKNIDPKFQECQELAQELLRIFLTLSFEIKSAQILSTKISTIKDSFIKESHNKNKEQPSLYEQLRDKYNQINVLNLVLTHELWEEIFDRGIYDAQELNNALANSKYFIDKHTPNWIKLWHFSELTDEQFDRILPIVTNDLTNSKYHHIGEVKHVIGLLLYFIETIEIELTQEDILQEALKNIHHIITSQNITTHSDQIDHFFRDSSWQGLGFYNNESPLFKELCENITLLIQKHTEENYISEANELLIGMKQHDVSTFSYKITGTTHHAGKYYNIPIFSYIEPQNFINHYINLNANTKRDIGYMFSKRYENSSYNLDLLPELLWIQNVKTLLQVKLPLTGTLSKYWAQQLCITLEKAEKQLLEEQSSHEAFKATAPQ